MEHKVALVIRSPKLPSRKVRRLIVNAKTAPVITGILSDSQVMIFSMIPPSSDFPIIPRPREKSASGIAVLPPEKLLPLPCYLCEKKSLSIYTRICDPINY